MQPKKRGKKKQKAIWLFAGGPMQELIAKKIKARAFALIITDFNKNCFCRYLADLFINLNTFDLKENVKAIQKVSDTYSIKAVLTTAADCHETVATVAKTLGLHGIDPRIAHACRQKLITRKILAKAGIPQPNFTFAKSLAEAKIAAKKIGFPCAIKATDNSGSRGFSKIMKMNDLNELVFDAAIKNGTTNKVIIEEVPLIFLSTPVYFYALPVGTEAIPVLSLDFHADRLSVLSNLTNLL